MLSKQSLMQATALLSVFAILSGCLGYFREGVVAYHFGPGAALDAYLAAFLIPTLFLNIISATLPYIFISLFNRIRVENGEAPAWAFAFFFMKRLVVLLVVLAAAGMFFSYPLMKAIATGFPEEQLRHAQQLFFILAPTFVFSGLFIFITAILQSHRHFFWPAVLNVSMNLFPLASIWIWGRQWGVASLAVGVVAGYAFQCVWIVWILLRSKPRFEKLPGRSFFIPGQEWIHFILPVVLLFGLDQINLLITRHFASFLEAGSISMLYFSSIIIQLIMTVVILPACKALYPDLTLSFAGGEDHVVRNKLYRTLRLFMLVTIPIVMGMVVLREEIIRLLFERGAFVKHYTHVTANIFLFYALAFIPVGIANVFLVVFFSMRRAWVPVLLTGFSIGVYVLAAWCFMPTHAVVGLGIANLFSTGFYSLGMLVYVHWRIFPLPWQEVGRPMMHAAALGLTMALVTSGIRWGWKIGLPAFPAAGMLGVNIVVSGFFYLALGAVLQNKEMLYWLVRFQNLVFRRGGQA